MTFTGAQVLSSPVVAWNTEDEKTLIYTSNEAGYLTAYDQATGLPVWSESFGGGMRSTPLVDGTHLWVAPTTAHRIYRLDAGTGAVQCSAPLPVNTDASPTIATPPGGSSTVYIGVNDNASINGPLVAIDEATCSIDFSSNPEPQPATGGIWDGVSYAVSSKGEGLVVFGTADPDSAVYAIDAKTGAKVWRYATQNPPPGIYDVGAGVTLSPPGVNGFADGVAYVINKYGWLDALDLTTGALIWSDHLQETISTPALDGTKLVFSQGSHLTCVNATTGAVEWTVADAPQNDSSPLIMGPAGSRVAVFEDLGGTLKVVSLATGSHVYSYQTSSFAVSSPAEVDGNIIDTSADGYLYDLALGGGNTPAPTTSVSSPAESSTVSSVGGSVTVSGTSTISAGGVGGVTVAIQQDGSAGSWWDSASSSWVSAPYPNPASLATPGGSSSTWRISFPVPAGGGTYEAFASAVSGTGIADTSAALSAATSARSNFTVLPTPGSARLFASAYWDAPDSVVTVHGGGFTAGETVSLSLGGTSIGSLTATSTGKIGPANIKVPLGASFGSSAIVAIGTTSGTAAAAPVYVTNSWAQQGTGSLHQAFEPNDSVLADHLAVSNGSFLAQAWSFSVGKALQGSPVVAQATAYLADEGGAVTAVNVRTGMTRWHHLFSGKPTFLATPAVDTSAGLVLVGSKGGQLFALSSSTGVLKWTATLSSAALDSAPAFAGGVVYVGDSSGRVYAVSEADGSTLWSSAVSGPIVASPAVDATSGVVVVGDTSGAVTALSTTNGAPLWSHSIGGSVTADPMIAKGDVYIGSSSRTFEAIQEKTGLVMWADSTSGGITASATLEGTNIFVGDANGNEYKISPSSGAMSIASTYTSPVEAVVSTSGFLVTVTSKGNLAATKGPGRGGWTTTLTPGPAGSPVLLNGELFFASSDGRLFCYTIPGSQAV